MRLEEAEEGDIRKRRKQKSHLRLVLIQVVLGQHRVGLAVGRGAVALALTGAAAVVALVFRLGMVAVLALGAAHVFVGAHRHKILIFPVRTVRSKFS
jgi:hypothetical protein